MEMSVEHYNKMAERLTELEYILAEQPEIIRCKDCINCSRDAIYDDYWCGGREVTADHYCGYAERREDE